MTQIVSDWNQPRSLKLRRLSGGVGAWGGGWHGSFLSPVAAQCASLWSPCFKWMPLWWKLKSGPCIAKKKKANVRAYPLHSLAFCSSLSSIIFLNIYLILFGYVRSRCSMQNLCCIMQDLSLQCTDSQLHRHGCSMACGVLFPWRGSNYIPSTARQSLNHQTSRNSLCPLLISPCSLGALWT